jgi:lipid A 4'-phosphatase
MLMPGRAVALMIGTLALAPGIVANNLLKDHWGRPRPIDVTVFGGDERFVPWWDPRGDCPKNCSFVAGEPSGAFWTLAPAALVPPPWRALAYGGGLAFGAGVGVLRMAGGGHFFSDVVFAGVFAFLIIWLAHGWLYRWPATAITDAAVERALETVALPVHRVFAWITARLCALARRRGADELS